MHVIDEAEYHRFLTEGTRTGKLATTRSDGAPTSLLCGLTLTMTAPRVDHRGRLGEGQEPPA